MKKPLAITAGVSSKMIGLTISFTANINLSPKPKNKFYAAVD
jgi:hypothetical protein